MSAQKSYFRPLVQHGPARPDAALPLAGGEGWFTHVEVLARGRAPEFIPASDMPAAYRDLLTQPRPPIAGLTFDRPRVMGILNATPDSFSDGGVHAQAEAAIAAGRGMCAAGVDILDIGGESTRPGSSYIDPDEEIARVTPVIAGLRDSGCPISIDTRKARVAQAAVAAGAALVNDVSGLTHDAEMAPLCASQNLPVCIMHAQGDPATMQQDPRYDDVLLDVYDALHGRIAQVQRQFGIAPAQIIADPGIGFGKTQTHNLALLARLSLFHALGVPVLLGASRKKFIGTIGKVPVAADRAAGSIGVALAALGHGIQVLRVHDVPQTIQAIALWRAATAGRYP